jgi:hypothetical protein
MGTVSLCLFSPSHANLDLSDSHSSLISSLMRGKIRRTSPKKRVIHYTAATDELSCLKNVGIQIAQGLLVVLGLPYFPQGGPDWLC